jgi:hypothetical protein
MTEIEPQQSIRDYSLSILVQNFENGQKIKTGNETKKRSFLIGKKIV